MSRLSTFGGERVGRCWGSLVKGAMWPVGVVVVDVVDDEAFELMLVPDNGAVEKLAAQGSDPAFRERVRHRGPNRCLEDLEAFGPEDLVEGLDELAAAVTDECSRIGESVVVA
jgi:hypothetical protein